MRMDNATGSALLNLRNDIARLEDADAETLRAKMVDLIDLILKAEYR